MPAKISKESLLILEKGLTSVDANWKSKYTLRQTIEKLFPALKRLRDLDLEWSEIALKIEELLEHKLTVNPTTLQKYYLQVAKSKDEKRTRASTQVGSRPNKPKSQSRLALESDETVDAPLDELVEPETTTLEEFGLDDAAIDNSREEDEASSTATILEELGLDDAATEASQEWVEPKFNHMRVTFSDD